MTWKREWDDISLGVSYYLLGWQKLEDFVRKACFHIYRSKITRMHQC
jgi:hypothetical protein